MSERAEPSPPATAVDIGNNHCIVFKEYNGERSGIDWWHKDKAGKWCWGWVALSGAAWAREFAGNAAFKGWGVTQPEPLTLHPSLHCLICGMHGFIRNGHWENA